MFEFCCDKFLIDKVCMLMEDEIGYDLNVWNEIVEFGWLGVVILEEMGGIGLILVEVVFFVEVMGCNFMYFFFVFIILVV